MTSCNTDPVHTNPILMECTHRIYKTMLMRTCGEREVVVRSSKTHIVTGGSTTDYINSLYIGGSTFCVHFWRIVNQTDLTVTYFL